MLKQRLIFGVLGIILALAVLIFGSVEFIGCCVAVLAIIALYEIYKVTGLFERKTPCVYIGFIFAIFSFVVAICGLTYLLNSYLAFFVLVNIYVFALMLCMVFFHDKCSFKDISLSFMSTVYITFFFVHIIFIRRTILGSFNIWLLFISAWACDTFAYFAGRFFGKHKLCPKISPKKTIEGAIGGTLGSVICITLYSYLVSVFADISFSLCASVLFALFTAIFSQIGDLAASCIKREHNVKDYGNLIPGHGGILDRFDSTLLIAPLAYYLIVLCPIF